MKSDSKTGDTEDQPPSKVEYLDYRAIVSNDWDVDDDDLFEKAAEADLDQADHGVIETERSKLFLWSIEKDDLKWVS